MNEQELIKYLIEWFNLIKDKQNVRFWSQNKIGILLKSELKKLGHWKNKSSGRKGNKEQLEKARKLKEIKIKEKEESDKKKRMLDW